MPRRLFPPLTGLLLACLCWLPAQAQEETTDPELPRGVRFVIDGYQLPPGSYTLLAREIGQSEPLLSVNAGRPMHPASTIKILTTLAGLERLGPGYRWHTQVYALGQVEDGTLKGDLLIKGGGDPFLTEDRFRRLLKALQRQGIERISGDLVIDASLFTPEVSQGKPIDNAGNRVYNVLPHPLMVNFRAVNFYFYPAPDGRNVVIRADPALPNLTIDNRLTLRDGPCRGYQRGIAFTEDHTNGTAIFSGQYPASCEAYRMPRAVLDAPSYAFGLFRALWQELGGDFAGDWRLGQAPEDEEPLVVWQSPPLSDIIKSINKYSNNMMTRTLLLTLGLERKGLESQDEPATVEKGIEAIHNYLDGLGIDRGSLVMDNGAGLARTTRVNGNLLAEMLLRGYSLPTMPEYIASLPLSGTDGTMRTRLDNNGIAGSVHVKTGSLSGVAGIAGYVHTRSGRQFAVVTLLNHPQADRGPGKELADAFLQWVWEQ